MPPFGLSELSPAGGRLQPSASAWVLQPSAQEIRSDAAVLSAF